MIDPISLIITALVAGATAAAKDTAEQAIKDAYKGLKDLINKKFINDSSWQKIVDGKPEEIKQVEDLLKEKLTQAGVDKDAEIIKAAEEIMKKEDPQGFKEGKYNITVQGDVIGIVGDNHGSVNIGGVNKGK